MFVADPDDPVRWRLTANLRCRAVWDREGKIPSNVPPYPFGPSVGPGHKEAYGWNWDYHTNGAEGGWKYIQMLEKDSPTGLTPRYPYRTFTEMFCGRGCHPDDLCLEGEIGTHGIPADSQSISSASNSDAIQ
jgi:hypothetical protein